MNDKRTIALGFLLAILVSAVLFAGFTYTTEQAGFQSPEYFGLLLLVGLQFSTLATAVIALPLFLLLRRWDILNGWWVLVAGSGVGFIMAIITEWPPGSFFDMFHLKLGQHAVTRAIAFSTIGATSSLAFWWRLTKRQTLPAQ